MFKIQVATAVFTQKINEYQRLTGKAMGEVITEQARLLAVRLTQLTFPKTAAIGKKRVAIDVGKVYMRSTWFEELFTFRNKTFGDKLKDSIRSRDSSAVEGMFSKSSRLSRIHVEPFDATRHGKLRRDGRIKIPNPNSFPVADQGKIKSFENEKKKNVGVAKSGWAACSQALGKSQPSWLNRTGTGGVSNHSASAERPHIILTNKVGFFARLDARANIVARSMEGRARDMIKSAENALRRAARAANVAP